MILLDGREYVKEKYKLLESRIQKLSQKPKLVIFLIGSKSDSVLYTNMKLKKCEKLGLPAERITYDSSEYENKSTDEIQFLMEQITDRIRHLNSDRSVGGIMVQLPLPSVLRSYTQNLLDNIDIRKDVDGLTSHSLGLLSMGNPQFISSTPKGAINLVEHYQIDLKGKYVVVIGASSLVGVPLCLLLTQKGATVTLCHIDTVDTKKHCTRADMIFTCCGQGKMIKKTWIKEGASIVDIGITVVESPFSPKKMVWGDCDFLDVKDKVKYITPVPGGIGPVTIYTLLEQLVTSGEKFYLNSK